MDGSERTNGVDVATRVATATAVSARYDQRVTSAEIIEEIGVRLARAAPSDSRVVLFGSHARGESDAGSDYDILVIEPEIADAARESVRLRTELGDLLVPVES